MACRPCRRLSAFYFLPITRIPLEHSFDSGCLNKNVTLEYCSADFALSRFAAALGDTTNVVFLQRSGNWRNLFNTNTGYIQPRNNDGTWVTNVTPSSQTGFTEGSAAQYLWMVPFNVRGLFDALGGNSIAVSRIGHFFLRAGNPQRIHHFADLARPLAWPLGSSLNCECGWDLLRLPQDLLRLL